MHELKVLIVDDHPVVRQGLRFMLQELPGVTVVGEASSGVEALTLAEKLRPTSVLMDVRMPEMDGLEATRHFKKSFPDIRVVMLTVTAEELSVVDALQAGADGYVLKNAPREEICQALALAANGAVAIRSQLLQRALNWARANPAPETLAPRRSLATSLSPRELTVLQLVAQGKTNKEIARLLTIAPATAKKHVERIVAKLDVADRTEAAIVALRQGLVE
ncbi:MAG: response regulator transcription factor [Chloroflexi bacterium]|nr:response regulator transcription factor [Chloroflexota bacterium]MCL5111202.1 response regulator transcription factor [Chloroflexota bacterium]